MMNEENKDVLSYRLTMLSLLLDRLEVSTCILEKERCRYCIDVVRNGYEEHFNEVLEFLGIELNTVSHKETEKIRSILRMYEDISSQIASMSPYEKKRLAPYLFSGLEEVSQHAYYMFLKKHGGTCVTCDYYLPRNLKEYEIYVEKYKNLPQPTTFNSLILIFETKKEAMRPLHL